MMRDKLNLLLSVKCPPLKATKTSHSPTLWTRSSKPRTIPKVPWLWSHHHKASNRTDHLNKFKLGPCSLTLHSAKINRCRACLLPTHNMCSKWHPARCSTYWCSNNTVLKAPCPTTNKWQWTSNATKCNNSRETKASPAIWQPCKTNKTKCTQRIVRAASLKSFTRILKFSKQRIISSTWKCCRIIEQTKWISSVQLSSQTPSTLSVSLWTTAKIKFCNIATWSNTITTTQVVAATLLKFRNLCPHLKRHP